MIKEEEKTTNLACLIEYDGSKFYGFQKQEKDHQNPNTRTIQTELERALSKFANQSVNVITAGRTDAGVHALGQVINFKTTVNRGLYGWIRGTNSFLPDDIVIHECIPVADDFSARFDAISRTYHYYLINSPTRPAVLSKKIGWVHGELNLQKMQEACQYLLGKHDFSSFRASNCQANNPVKIMTQSEMSIINPNIICFKFTANSFLYHMVRNLVGALIHIGKGKLNLAEFISIIDARNRIKAPPTFMPDGLYLAKVTYKDNRNPNFKHTPVGF
jgi:tRNA pseudouridine38-40 synthase